MALLAGFRGRWRQMLGGAAGGRDAPGDHIDAIGEVRAAGAANGGLPRVATPILAPTPAEELRGAFDRLSVQLESHLGRETGALADLKSSLEPLGRAGEALGELRRNSITLNETLAEHAERARRASEGTQSLLQRVGDSLVSQADVVTGMQQQIDGLVRTFATVGEDLDRLRASLGQIADHSSRSAGSLADLVEQQALREGALVDELRRFRAWTTGLLVCILLSALVAGIVAAVIFAQAPA